MACRLKEGKLDLMSICVIVSISSHLSISRRAKDSELSRKRFSHKKIKRHNDPDGTVSPLSG